MSHIVQPQWRENTISMVVACAENGVIGYRGRLPWHYSEDLKHFKRLTIGKAVIMGRNSWDEIYHRLGRGLPHRRNIVLSHRDLEDPEAIRVSSREEALRAAQGEEVMVIGGAKIYEMFLSLTDRIYMTRIFGSFEGDCFFPTLRRKEWEETMDRDCAEFAFFTLTRRRERRRQ